MYKNDFESIIKKVEELNSRSIKTDIYNDDDYNMYDSEKLSDQKEDSIGNNILDSHKINIDDFEFIIYLIKLDSVPIITFDEEYNMTPKSTIIQYEVGINVNYQDVNNKIININGLSRLLSPNKELANTKYQELKELLNSNELNKILKKINDDLDIELKG